MQNFIIQIYSIYIIIVIAYIFATKNNFRLKHRKYLYNAISSILERDDQKTVEEKLEEIEEVYNTCCKFYKDLYRVYPSIVYVLDDIHAVINTKIKCIIVNEKTLKIFRNNYDLFRQIQNKAKRKYQFYEFNERQQSILQQIKQGDDNLIENMIIEFRMEEIEKASNKKNNSISISIGVIGILISIAGVIAGLIT